MMRNYIHGDVIRFVTLMAGSAPRENLFVVPIDDREAIEEIVDRRGGREAWGHRPLVAGQVCLEPGEYVEQIVPRATAALDAIIRETDTARLEGVDESALMTGPTSDQIFSGPLPAAIRRLAGL